MEEKEEEEQADSVHKVRTANVVNNSEEPEVVEQRSQTTKDVCNVET